MDDKAQQVTAIHWMKEMHFALIESSSIVGKTRIKYAFYAQKCIALSPKGPR